MTLTSEQQTQLKNFAERWRDQVLRTDAIDPHEVQSTITAGYKLLGYATPQIVFCSSPWNIIEQARSYAPQGGGKGPAATTGKLLSALAGGSDGLLSILVNAQPAKWPALGGEVDLRDSENVNPIIRQCGISLPRPIDRIIDVLSDLKGAVDLTLRTRVTDSLVAWLHNTGCDAASSMSNFLYYEFAAETQSVPCDIKRLTTIRDAIWCAWSTKPFEKVCFVSDRPSTIIHPKLQKDATVKFARVVFRDGFEGTLDPKIFG